MGWIALGSQVHVRNTNKIIHKNHTYLSPSKAIAKINLSDKLKIDIKTKNKSKNLVQRLKTTN